MSSWVGGLFSFLCRDADPAVAGFQPSVTYVLWNLVAPPLLGLCLSCVVEMVLRLVRKRGG